MIETRLGDETISYLEEVDLLECRVCHVRPVVKHVGGSSGAVRVECPCCGIRTGQSTNEQGVYIDWFQSTRPVRGATCRPGGGTSGRRGRGGAQKAARRS